MLLRAVSRHDETNSVGRNWQGKGQFYHGIHQTTSPRQKNADKKLIVSPEFQSTCS